MWYQDVDLAAGRCSPVNPDLLCPEFIFQGKSETEASFFLSSSATCLSYGSIHVQSHQGTAKYLAGDFCRLLTSRIALIMSPDTQE